MENADISLTPASPLEVARNVGPEVWRLPSWMRAKVLRSHGEVTAMLEVMKKLDIAYTHNNALAVYAAILIKNVPSKRYAEMMAGRAAKMAYPTNLAQANSATLRPREAYQGGWDDTIKFLDRTADLAREHGGGLNVVDLMRWILPRSVTFETVDEMTERMLPLARVGLE
jgi:hypothetical protein